MSNLKTAYCGFPLLAAGQAQKEITHNEALTLADALISGAVEAGPLNAPPSAPTSGQMWIVGDNPSGSWAQAAGQLALWTQGGWRFLSPHPGQRLWDKTSGRFIWYRESAWTQTVTLNQVTGGTVVDTEAREALVTIRNLLISLGVAVP